MHRGIVKVLLAVAASTALSGAAHAGGDAVRSFEMLGTLRSGESIGGTLEVDLTTGRAIAANIKIYSRKPYYFNHIALQQSYGFAYVVTLTGSDPNGCPVFMFGERDTPYSLQDYQGGYLGPRSSIRFCDGAVDAVTYGSLTPLY